MTTTRILEKASTQTMQDRLAVMQERVRARREAEAKQLVESGSDLLFERLGAYGAREALHRWG